MKNSELVTAIRAIGPVVAGIKLADGTVSYLKLVKSDLLHSLYKADPNAESGLEITVVKNVSYLSLADAVAAGDGATHGAGFDLQSASELPENPGVGEDTPPETFSETPAMVETHEPLETHVAA